MTGSLPCFEGDRSACLQQMAQALNSTPFRYVTYAATSTSLQNYIIPHNLGKVFASTPDQALETSVMGLMNMNATFIASFKSDNSLVYMGLDNYTAVERLGVYSDWFRKKLMEVSYQWLTDR